MHTTFPMEFTKDIVSKLPIGEDGEIIEPSTFKKKCVETQYLATLKSNISEIQTYEQEHEEHRWESARKELNLLVTGLSFDSL